MADFTDFANSLVIVVKNGVDVAIMGAGLPLQVISALNKSGISDWKTKFWHMVS